MQYLRRSDGKGRFASVMVQLAKCACQALYLLSVLCNLTMKKSSAMMSRVLLRSAISSNARRVVHLSGLRSHLSGVVSPGVLVEGAYVQLKTGETLR